MNVMNALSKIFIDRRLYTKAKTLFISSPTIYRSKSSLLHYKMPFTLKTRKTFDESTIYIHRKLIVFDFDHTIVEENTDIVVRNLVDKGKISDDVKKLYTDSGWIPYMQEIFHILHANNITKSEIKATVENIPEVNGLKELIRKLHRTGNIDIVIISDSNSVFINYWCDFNGMTKYIKKIYTNQAEFIENDILKIQPYHHQTNCDLSSVNLCKGDILEEFVKNEFEQNNVIYSKIFYIGDGHNDVCPVLRLGAGDYGLARKGFAMEREIDAVPKEPRVFNGTFRIWSDGRDLDKIIFDCFSENCGG